MHIISLNHDSKRKIPIFNENNELSAIHCIHALLFLIQQTPTGHVSCAQHGVKHKNGEEQTPPTPPTLWGFQNWSCCEYDTDHGCERHWERFVWPRCSSEARFPTGLLLALKIWQTCRRNSWQGRQSVVNGSRAPGKPGGRDTETRHVAGLQWAGEEWRWATRRPWEHRAASRGQAGARPHLLCADRRAGSVHHAAVGAEGVQARSSRLLKKRDGADGAEEDQGLTAACLRNVNRVRARRAEGAGVMREKEGTNVVTSRFQTVKLKASW